jgi:hypothetical protein
MFLSLVNVYSFAWVEVYPERVSILKKSGKGGGRALKGSGSIAE